MRVAYFPNQCAQNSVPVIQAMLTSLKNFGHTVVENSLDCDAAIIWSVLWSGRMRQNQQIWNHYTALGLPVIVADVGSLYRGETWKIALKSINAQGDFGHTKNLDWDRPKKLGISLSINVSRNPRIVIAAQHSKSMQISSLINQETWISSQIKQLNQICDRPIVIRPHPRSTLNWTLLGDLPDNVVIETPQKIANSYDSYNLVFDCHAMVNYNSSPGIQAALAGTRPVVDQSSLAYPVGVKIQNIEHPYDVDRHQWLVEICHTEYTLQEIGQGTWLHRLNLI